MPLEDHVEKLVGFITAADEGSFHKAAAKLHVSQPSISYAVKVIESVLGADLFVRSPRGLSLTPEGHELLKWARHWLAEVRGVETSIKQSAGNATPLFRIGAFESHAIHVWPQFLSIDALKLQTQRIEMITGRSDFLHREIVDGHLDLALLVEPPEHPAVCATVLYEDDFAFYESARFPLQSASKDLRESLRTFGLVGFQDAALSPTMTLGDVLAQQGLESFVRYRVESFEAVASITVQGLGIGILPRKIFKFMSARQQCSLREISHSLPFGTHRIFICSPVGKGLRPPWNESANLLAQFLDRANTTAE